MKLSEAIRKGAKLRPQCSSSWTQGGTCSCAVAAAAEATGLYGTCLLDTDFYAHFDKVFPGWRDLFENKVSPLGQISLWNACMTREQVADMVEALEKKLPQKERETDDAYTKRVLSEIVATASQSGASVPATNEVE